MNRYGEKVELEGSLMASAHRFFMDLKDKFDDESDEALMGSIVTGESELMSCYRDAMKDAKYDPEILNELQKQYREVSSHIDIIQAKKKVA